MELLEYTSLGSVAEVPLQALDYSGEFKYTRVVGDLTETVYCHLAYYDEVDPLAPEVIDTSILVSEIFCDSDEGRNYRGHGSTYVKLIADLSQADLQDTL